MRRARKDVAGITSADDAIALIHTVWPIEAATLTRLEQRVSPPSSPRQRRTAYLLCVAYRIDPAELDLSPADGPGVGVQHLRWCRLRNEGLRDDDPTARLIRPRLGRRTPRPISEADLHVAIDRAPDRYRPWLILAAYTGLRAMEIAQLRREDVMDRQNPPVLVVVNGKGSKDRVVPLSPLVIRTLYSVDLPARGRLFRTIDGRWMTPANLSSIANRHLRDVGVEATLHQLRHRFATRLYAECGDLRVVQELLGHASPRTTAAYAAYSEAVAVAAVTAIAA
jgi:integrase